MCLMIGYFAVHNHTMKQNNKEMTEQIAHLKKQQASLRNKKPTIKRVTSNYQKAVNDAKVLLDSEKTLTLYNGNAKDKPSKADYKKAKINIAKLIEHDSADVDFDATKRELFPETDWQTKFVYGGQDSSGDITCAFISYKDTTMMKTWEATYNPTTRMFTFLRSFVSDQAQNEIMKAQQAGQAAH